MEYTSTVYVLLTLHVKWFFFLRMDVYYSKDEEQYEMFSGNACGALKTVHELKTHTDNIVDVKQGSNPYCFYAVNFKPKYDDKIDEVSDVISDLCWS